MLIVAARRGRRSHFMTQTKQAPKRKRSTKALTVLSVAGASLAATVCGAAAEMLPPGTSELMPFSEEEISDVSLATFHLPGKDITGQPLLRLARCGGCGCGHGGGCGGGGCAHAGGCGCAHAGGCALGGMHGCAFGGVRGCALGGGCLHGCAGRGCRGCRGGCGCSGFGWGGCGDWGVWGGCCLSWGGCQPWC